MKKILNLILFMCASIVAVAQQGTVRGTLIDDISGEPIIGAVVRAEGQPGGAVTDVEGGFNISIVPGVHKLSFKYGVDTHYENDVRVVADDITVLNARFKTPGSSIVSTAVVVKAERKKNTETALQTRFDKSINVMSGISAEVFKKTGDNNAGQAVARVTGISVQGNKHVFVRGLGDRYTKTTLNGMIIPGLDPDRNTVQMDIFPTNVLDNIVVFKTFTPDLPGDFTGGTVDVATKAFPNKKSMSFSGSLGFNPTMHLNDNYIAYKGGKLDWLAIEDGTRSLPIPDGVDVTDRSLDPTANNPELTNITRSFNKTLAPTQQTSTPNFRLAYSMGDQYNLESKATMGYNLALNYNKSTDFYENAYYSTYIKSQNPEVNELEKDRDTRGPQSSNTAQWSVLAGGAYQKGTNKYSLSFFRTQNAESRSGQFWQQDYRENPYRMVRNNLEYTQRSVSNLLLSGKHALDSGRTMVEWKLSPTVSTIDEPDIRLTAFELTDDANPVFIISPATGAVASRTYRALFEQNYNAKFDVTRKFIWKGEDSKLKFGMLETFKQRDYSIEDYRFNVQTASTEFTFDGENANDLLADENIWVPASGGYQDSGVFVQGQRLASNTYDATQNIAALYGMTELAFSGRLKTIVGLRYEHAFNTYTGEDQNRNRFNNETVLNKGVILPSLNFVYKINSESKIRTSVTRTVARPSFKELSNAQIVDRISGRTFLGNINLEQTDITNFDFRFERFMRKNQRLDGQSYAISGFYKHFTNPIELVAFDDAAPNDFQPQNVGNATVYGIELEMKENIKFMTKDTVYETNFGANVTLVKSQVEMTPGEVQGRIESARMGEDIQIFRDMVGQSPYIVNAFFNFIHEKTNSEFALSYNVQGQRLSIVGVGRNPDVYEMPFHSLNLKASTLLGKENKWKASVTARNLLNSERYLEYQSYGAENQLFSRLRPQQSFSVSIGYTL